MENKTGKILIAEDDKFLSRILQTKLQESGFEVVIAMDGEEALEKARAEEPQLILLDMIMPKKNGFETLEALKADPNLRKINVIILSNLGETEDVKTGLHLGAKDYIVKSNISIDEVVKKVKEYI